VEQWSTNGFVWANRVSVKHCTFGDWLRIPHLNQEAIEVYFEVGQVIYPEPKTNLRVVRLQVDLDWTHRAKLDAQPRLQCLALIRSPWLPWPTQEEVEVARQDRPAVADLLPAKLTSLDQLA